MSENSYIIDKNNSEVEFSKKLKLIDKFLSSLYIALEKV